MKSHAEIIQAFGSTKQIAEAIGVEPRIAIHWPRRGIPAKYWPEVEATDIGRRHGITALLLRRLPATVEQAA